MFAKELKGKNGSIDLHSSRVDGVLVEKTLSLYLRESFAFWSLDLDSGTSRWAWRFGLQFFLRRGAILKVKIITTFEQKIK